MKKQTLKKIIVAVMVAIMLLLAINVQVFASITEDTDTSSIVVSGLEAGVTVTAYRILIINYDYDADQPSTPMYSWANDSIQSWVDENYPDYSDPEDFSAVTDSDTLTAFYSNLAVAIKSEIVTFDEDTDVTYEETTEGTASYPVTSDSLTESVTFENVEMGQYLLITENGYMVYVPATASVIPSYNSESGEWELEESYTAEVKATTPQIVKTVTDTSKTEDNYSTTDTILYTVVADIPTYASGSLSTTYEITDTLCSGLTLDTSTIKIYGDSTELSSSAYTITYTSTGFTIVFDYSAISSYSKITITYSATLNQDSTLELGLDDEGNAIGNTNISTLTYSNNPYTTDSSTTQSDGAVVYTYGIEITKVDYTDTDITLEGAEFELSSNGSTLSFISVDGIYYLTSSSTEDSTTTLISDEDGKIVIYGLDEGTYYLQETKAADGYNVDSTKITITLTDANVDGILDSDTDAIYELTVKNKEGFSLPTTGGIGTVIFVIVGILLIGGGLTLIIISAKKKTNK